MAPPLFFPPIRGYASEVWETNIKIKKMQIRRIILFSEFLDGLQSNE